MNFLALANRLKLECGVSGTDLTAVTSLTGEQARLVAWINSAWLDIQSLRRGWEWMRASASFATVAGQSTYTPAQCGVTNFGAWARDTFRVYNTAAGIGSEIPLAYIEYEAWRDTYLIGANRSTYSEPLEITITPAKSLGFGPITAAGYTIVGDYYTLPAEMAATTDTPALPTQFHMAIVYKAMMDYGLYYAAPEVYTRGEKKYKEMKGRFDIDQLPDMQFAGALA